MNNRKIILGPNLKQKREQELKAKLENTKASFENVSDVCSEKLAMYIPVKQKLNELFGSSKHYARMSGAGVALTIAGALISSVSFAMVLGPLIFGYGVINLLDSVEKIEPVEKEEQQLRETTTKAILNEHSVYKAIENHRNELNDFQERFETKTSEFTQTIVENKPRNTLEM